MVNGAEDVKTPALRCLKLYETLLENNVKAELHIYGKGGHGFDSGIGRGFAGGNMAKQLYCMVKRYGVFKVIIVLWCNKN